MIFRRKRPPDSRRTRQPDYPAAGTSATPVFSYHAQSARSEPAAGRRAIRLPWASSAATKQSSPRHDPRHWPKRIAVVSAAVLAVVLAADGLFLVRNPAIVVHEQADGRQFLLRGRDVYQEAAQDILNDSLANTTKLTINTDKIAQAMEARFPELGQVSVVLPVLGRQPTVHIQTVRPALMLASSRTGGVFLLDDSGRAVMDAAKVTDAVKRDLPVVQDQSGLPVAVGKSALPRDNVSFITEVIGQLKAKNIRVSSLVLPAGVSELDVRVEGLSYMVKFNLRGDARAEAGAFLAVKQHLERENKTPASYVDVRVDNKAYYQ